MEFTVARPSSYRYREKVERRLLNCRAVAQRWLRGNRTEAPDLPLSRWGSLDKRNEVEFNVLENEQHDI